MWRWAYNDNRWEFDSRVRLMTSFCGFRISIQRETAIINMKVNVSKMSGRSNQITQYTSNTPDFLISSNKMFRNSREQKTENLHVDS